MTQIGLLLFPNLTQLDLTGPYEVFSRAPETEVHLLWKSRDPVRTDRGMLITPTTTLAEAPKLDVICVPGGPGQSDLMLDDEALSFIARQARDARYVTSVCTGALVLGAAGLLRGKRATTHWASLDLLPLFGATPVRERVVRDGNLFTGGGVTAGIDFGLSLVAAMQGEAAAKRVQLQIEYAPAPPFSAGLPETAGDDIVGPMRQMMVPMLAKRREIAEAAARRLAGK
jgi:cyclohexyl-isocyanide hydratase